MCDNRAQDGTGTVTMPSSRGAGDDEGNDGPIPVLGLEALCERLAGYHPVFIEGPSRDAARDPACVATRICGNIERHVNERRVTKPLIIVIQGDPWSLGNKGISNTTRNVAEGLGICRCLVCLDEATDANHAEYADRHNVVFEMRFSDMRALLSDNETTRLTDAVDAKIMTDNVKRAAMGKDPLKAYVKEYALLQEVTKVAVGRAAGTMSVAHTHEPVFVNEGVTGFYQCGVHVGLTHATDMISY